MTVGLPVQKVFAIFEDPYNLARITPAWLNFRITSNEKIVMRKGAEITYQIRWAGIPLSWKTKITEYEPPFYFVDEQVSGPYALWRHHHTFRSVEAGSVVSDRVEYALPLGIIGRIAHKVWVSKQLREIFAFRQESLATLMGTRATSYHAPSVMTTVK